MEPPKVAYCVIAEEAIRNQLHHLEETIGRLIRLKDALDESSFRDRLLEEINALDSIADVIRQALDSMI
jgi:hypothetical protein